MYCPDNYDLYRQHEAEQEAWLEKRPKCSVCGEHIQDDTLYDIDGGLYCERCLNNEFMHSTETYMREGE